MKLVSNKNTLIVLAAILVVGLGMMMLSLIQKPASQAETFNQEIQMIETQSESTEIEAIEKDLLETDFSNLDQELNEIEKELEIID